MKSSGCKLKSSAAERVFTTLRKEILAGKYDAERRFPSEQQLVRRFDLSRMTIRLALNRLKTNGMLETRTGSGTYLSPFAHRATGKLGLIVPHIIGGELSPPICAELGRVARDEGYSIIFGNSSYADGESRIQRMTSLAWHYVAQGVAGVFLEPIELVDDAESATRHIIDFLNRHKVPVVLLDQDIVDPPRRSPYDLVTLDNVQIGYRVATHLVEASSRHVCLFARPESAPTVKLRFQGAREALLDAAFHPSNITVLLGDPSDAEALSALLSKTNAPDAFLCANDITAVTLMKTLQRIGKRIPSDILVTGIDDIQVAARSKPSLTTVRQPYREIAHAALATMLQRLRDPTLPPRQIMLDAPLVIRRSTRRKTPRKVG